jgi:hypothetical protein
MAVVRNFRGFCVFRQKPLVTFVAVWLQWNVEAEGCMSA